jgi:hypothetical protein
MRSPAVISLLCLVIVASTKAQLPGGWKKINTVSVPATQVEAISRKLGGRITHAGNTIYNVRGASLKIIELKCPSARDASAVYASMAKLKSPRFLKRDGNRIREISSRSNRASIEATHVFRFQPVEMTYRVEFDAVPITTGDYMKWNQLFNAFLLHNRNPSSATDKRISGLAKHFQIGRQIALRKYGQGKTNSRIDLQPGRAPGPAALPTFSVSAIIHSQTLGFTPREATDVNQFTNATVQWPVDDPAIRKLAATIAGAEPNPDHRVQAILQWLLDRQNIRYDGKVRGSRYGVAKVIEQRFGHCWDYSDLFVTLCRAVGVPARQVLGWHAYQQGHVWAEILKPGQGWIPLDPTSGMGCGSEFIPIMTTIDGEIPLVYASMPRITVIKPQ